MVGAGGMNKSEGGLKRCFFGVPLPKGAKEQLFETYSSKLNLKDFKIVPVQNLHITMLFLGSISSAQVQEFSSRVSALEFKKFWATISGAGNFGKNVLFAKLAKGERQLEDIHSGLCSATGVVPEKPFHAHATLARTRKNAFPNTGGVASVLSRIPFSQTFLAEKLCLYESVETGKKYAVLEEFGFK